MTPLLLVDSPDAIQGVFNFITRGGMFMWPLLICSIVAVTMILLRAHGFAGENVVPLVLETRDRTARARGESRSG